MSMASFRYTPQARRDAIEIATYIATGSIKAADKFLYTLQETCEDIAAMPELGKAYRSSDTTLRNIRVTRVSKTYAAYKIFYRPIEDDIEVVRILHGARDVANLLLR